MQSGQGLKAVLFGFVSFPYRRGNSQTGKPRSNSTNSVAINGDQVVHRERHHAGGSPPREPVT